MLLTAWGEADRRAVLAAIPVAVCIAAYTFSTGTGCATRTRRPYLWLTMAPVVLALLDHAVVVIGGLASLYGRSCARRPSCSAWASSPRTG